jgi:AraC-like DNA-binding protein
VWDYFVKSVFESAIVHSIMPLQREEGCQGRNRHTPRNPIMPAHHSPDNSIPLRLSRTERAILRAYAYTETHLEEKISERTVARFCGLSPACFSRTFKRINGLAFSRFVLKARVKEAVKFLQNRHASMTEVCHAAGLKTCLISH